MARKAKSSTKKRRTTTVAQRRIAPPPLPSWARRGRPGGLGRVLHRQHAESDEVPPAKAAEQDRQFAQVQRSMNADRARKRAGIAFAD